MLIPVQVHRKAHPRKKPFRWLNIMHAARYAA